MKRFGIFAFVCLAVLVLPFDQVAADDAKKDSKPSDIPDFSRYELRRILDPPKFQHSHDVFIELSGKKTMLTGGGYSLKIWSVPDAKLLAAATPGRALLTDADFTPDGKYVVALWQYPDPLEGWNCVVRIYESKKLSTINEVSWPAAKFRPRLSIAAIDNKGTFALALGEPSVGIYRLPLEVAQVDAAVIRKHIGQLGSESYEEREAAFKALVEIGFPVLPFLRKALKSADLEIVHSAGKLIKMFNHGRHVRTISTRKNITSVTRVAGGAMLGVSVCEYSALLMTSTGKKIFERDQQGTFLRSLDVKRFAWHCPSSAPPNNISRLVKFAYDPVKGSVIMRTEMLRSRGLLSTCYCGDERHLAIVWDNGIQFYDWKTGRMTAKILHKDREMFFAEITAGCDSNLFALNLFDGVHFFSFKNSKLSEIPIAGSLRIHHTEVSPDGRLCAQFMRSRRKIVVRRLSDAKIVYEWESGKFNYDILCRFTGCSSRLLMAACGERTLRMVDTKTWKDIWNVETDRAKGVSRDIAVTSDGKKIFIKYDKDVEMRNAETGEILKYFKRSDYQDADCFILGSPDGTLLLMRKKNGLMQVISTSTGKVLWTQSEQDIKGDSMVFSEDSARLIVFVQSPVSLEKYVLDAKTGEVLSHKSGVGYANTVSYGPRLLLRESEKGTNLIDIPTLKNLFTLPRFLPGIYRITLVNGWKKIIFTCSDGSIWEFAPKKK